MVPRLVIFLLLLLENVGKGTEIGTIGTEITVTGTIETEGIVTGTIGTEIIAIVTIGIVTIETEVTATGTIETEITAIATIGVVTLETLMGVIIPYHRLRHQCRHFTTLRSCHRQYHHSKQMLKWNSLLRHRQTAVTCEA